MLYKKTIPSPLGELITLADAHSIYLLQFSNSKKLDHQINEIKQYKNCEITEGICAPLVILEYELTHYFTGELKNLNTPIKLIGTSFEKTVWKETAKIHNAEHTTDKKIAETIGFSNNLDEVTTALNANKIIIFIPTHRVIHTNTINSESNNWLLNLEERTDLNKKFKLS